jgi:putative intracellular protease/amidase
VGKVAVLVADAFQDSEYFRLKIEIEKLGVETETISISKSPVEIYSFFKSIGHLNVDKSIDEAKPGDYVGVLVPVVQRALRSWLKMKGSCRSYG